MANTKGVCVAEAKGKNRVARPEFEYRRNRTGRTRYEVSLAKANAEAIAGEKGDAVTGDVAADRADEKPVKARTKT